MKRKKAGNRLDWKAEWIKEWGSPAVLFFMEYKNTVRYQSNGS